MSLFHQQIYSSYPDLKNRQDNFLAHTRLRAAQGCSEAAFIRTTAHKDAGQVSILSHFFPYTRVYDDVDIMNSHANGEVQKPVPQYLFPSSTNTLLECVSRELERERQQNLQLLQQLAAERKRIQELELRLLQTAQNASFLPSSFRRVGSSSSLASTEGSKSGLGSRVQSADNLLEAREVLESAGIEPLKPVCDETPVIGAYSLAVRREKIAKYKEKLKNHMRQARLNRAYKGRSRIANIKPREKGRFVKTSQ